MPPKPKKPISCERCRNFTGSSFWYRFSCAKGHTQDEPEHDYALQRKSCADYDEATRAELICILRRSVFAGGEAIQRDASTVKRTATTLRRLVHEEQLGQYLTTTELDHCKAVLGALDQLVPDLNKAAKMAEKYHADQVRSYQDKRQQDMIDLVATLLPDQGMEDYLLCAADLYAFGRKWRGPDEQRPALTLYDSDALPRLAAAFVKSPNPAMARQVAIELGEALDQLKVADLGRQRGGMKDFLEYRKFLAMTRQVVNGSGGLP